MTHRLPGHRSFSADLTSHSHTRILPDSVAESKAPTPIQYLKGVGPARAQLLSQLGILQPAELATYFPRDWEDRRLRYSIRNAPSAQKITLRGQVRDVDFSTTRNSLGIATATLQDDTGIIQAVWFKKTNPRYDVFASLRNRLQSGCHLMVFGLVEQGIRGRQIRVEEMGLCTGAGNTLSPDDVFHIDRIAPLYSVPEGLSERFLRGLIGRTLPETAQQHPEIVPAWLRKKLDLSPKKWSLQNIHFPESLVQKEKAREHLAFEEFLILETSLTILRSRAKEQPKPHQYTLGRQILTPFKQRLGFPFTNAQKRVIREIFEDMMRPVPMNRLLQGDVGSGKTLVALCAMLLAVENGGQAVLMAPTEILAEQHALTFAKFLQGSNVRIVLLTGRQSGVQRKQALQEIAKGKIDLVIGTHALIQKNARFAKLMLAVIDEQHRFGVEHRSLLRQKGELPDVLVMTATPIPRTLALTIYGDLDVSTIDELPPGRAPIVTRHVLEKEAYAAIRQTVAQGQQAYLVYPLVEESDKVELKAAVQEARALCQSELQGLRVGILHGQLPSHDKERTMEEFRTGKLDVLIATSIIEVGIDVANATLMVIEHADRFGLATLHQLRGRVGRGSLPSACLLIARAESEEARRRIRIMTSITDGFALSEEDLSLRGPGEILGKMQHGIPAFRIGHLIRDGRIIQQARSAAIEIFRRDEHLADPTHLALRRAISASTLTGEQNLLRA